MFVRGVFAAAGNYPRSGFAATWAGDFAAGRNIHADAQRRLSVENERSRADRARDSSALACGCRSVRRIFQDDDPDVPVREADSLDDSAGSHDPAAEGFAATAFLDATVPGFVERRAVHAGAADDHVGGGFSGPVV